MADKFPEPLSGMVVPRFGEVATFMRLRIEAFHARRHRGGAASPRISR